MQNSICMHCFNTIAKRSDSEVLTCFSRAHWAAQTSSANFQQQRQGTEGGRGAENIFRRRRLTRTSPASCSIAAGFCALQLFSLEGWERKPSSMWSSWCGAAHLEEQEHAKYNSYDVPAIGTTTSAPSPRRLDGSTRKSRMLLGPPQRWWANEKS